MANKDLTIAIVDDHHLFRKGLSALIGLFPNCRVMFEAGSGQELIDYFSSDNEHPDILLLDIIMEKMDGYEVALWMKNNLPAIKILALSTMESDNNVIRMIRSGAHGYLLKSATPEELKMAFSEVMSLGYHYNEHISRKIIGSINQLVDEKSDISVLMKLSGRELEFIKYACSEDSYQEIAEKMHLSERTIDGYRDSLFKKLNISSRVGLVIYAIKNGLVKI